MDLLGMISLLEVKELKDKIHIYNVLDFGAGDHLEDNRYPFQLALYEAKGNKGHSVVYVPPGTYKIKEKLYIADNITLLLADGTTIKRNATMNAMIINDGQTTIGGYAKNRNIKFIGGTWDANKSQFPSTCSMIAFTHCSDIVIKDTNFINNYDWHMLEVNASKHVLIDNCKFEGYGTATTGTEAIQIDHSSAAGWVWGGLIDETFCRDITVQNCTFDDGVSAIGTHSFVANKQHRDIKILNNYFSNHRSEVIRGLGWSDVVIENNYFIDANYGIYLYTDGSTVSENIKIRNNTFKNINKSNQARGIHLVGVKGSTGIFKHCLIEGNHLDTIGKHGITADFCQYVKFINNTAINCREVGIWVGFGGSNHIVTGNTAINNNLSNASFTFDIHIGYEPSGVSNCIISGNNVGKLAYNNVDSSIISENFCSQVIAGTKTNCIVKDFFVNGTITNTI